MGCVCEEHIHRIGFKVFLYFLISVVLIILIGVVSYRQVSGIITEKYMESTLKGIKMSSEYVKARMKWRGVC